MFGKREYKFYEIMRARSPSPPPPKKKESIIATHHRQPKRITQTGTQQSLWLMKEDIMAVRKRFHIVTSLSYSQVMRILTGCCRGGGEDKFMLINVLKTVLERTRDEEISIFRNYSPSPDTYDPMLSGTINVFPLTFVPSFAKLG